VHPLEQQAFGVERRERAAWFDESMAVMRACWTGQPVVHDGERFHYDGVRVRPVPARMDVWLGGYAPSELRRVGRLADGWLPSFTTPSEVAAGREVVADAAATAGRAIDPEHWGALVAYAPTEVPPAVLELVAKRLPGVDPVEVVPVGPDALRRTLEGFIAVGFSKLVPVPFGATIADWDAELATLAAATLDLAT
jgi:probable F420-dependent oxidoreductase